MQVTVQFYSYFKEIAGVHELAQEMPEGSSLQDLLEVLWTRFPRLGAMRRSTLVAVGLEYRDPAFILHDQDRVSLFPPVQGG
jgi:molybdopterin converting factor small subunit